MEQTIHLPESEDTLVLRSDFSFNEDWEQVCELIKQSGRELGFAPYVTFVDDKQFDNIKIDMLPKGGTKECNHFFLFIVDSMTMNQEEHPILCVDIFDEFGKSFRVIPEEMWSVENNLSIANMDFSDFYEATDEDGVFRGF